MVHYWRESSIKRDVILYARNTRFGCPDFDVGRRPF